MFTHLGFAAGILAYGGILEYYSSTKLAHAHDVRLIVTAMAMVIGTSIMFILPKHKIKREANLRQIFAFMKIPKFAIASFLQFASALGFGILLGLFSDYIKEEYGSAYLSITSHLRMQCSSCAMLLVCNAPRVQCSEDAMLLVCNAPRVRAFLSFGGGALSDRLGRGKTLFISFVIGAVGLLIAGFWQSLTAAALAAFSLGFQGGLVPPISMAIIGEETKSQRRHLALGAVFFWRDLGVVLALLLGPSLKLMLKSFQSTFGIFSIIFLLCAIVSVILMRTEEYVAKSSKPKICQSTRCDNTKGKNQ